MWKEISAAPADSILGLTEAFKKDSNRHKVNLGVGVYQDDNGRTPVLKCVKEAERILLEKEHTKSYLPISGDPFYCGCVQKLLFGEKSKIIADKRAATVHAPGGTGALRVGGELLRKFRSGGSVWVSSPTWANHIGIFKESGFSIKEYPYYDNTTKGVDYQGFVDCLQKIPAQDIVLLHGCCHNPSGVDLTKDQWQEVAEIAAQKRWLPFLDFAYQGLSDGVEDDREGIAQFITKDLDLFIASSFSKNFGLYNERTGAMTVVSPSKEETAVAMSHLKTTVRVIYSNPPAHGGLIVATVLGDQKLSDLWLGELNGMRERIIGVRNALVDGLEARGIEKDFSYIKKQKGMFSFSGLGDEIVEWLRVNRSIYVVKGGRINIAGLTSQNIDYVCDAIAEALKQ